MLKKVLAATALMALAGSSIVYAQRANGPDGRDGPRRDMHRHAQRPHFTPEDMSAFADARVAALKAGLKLSADQEKNWPAFETAYRNLAKLRADRIAQRMENWKKRREARQEQNQKGENQKDQDAANATPNRPDPLERMQRRADAMSKNATAFKALTDAAAPLYQSLDEAQTRRFTFLIRPQRFAMGGPMAGHGQFEHHGPRGFRHFEHRGPRFGAAEGLDGQAFAANVPANPDLSGMTDDLQAD
jgi:hypothetical protein